MKTNSLCIALRGMDSIWSLNRHNDPFRTKQTWNSWVSFKFWIISPLLIWRHLNWLNLDSARGSRYKFFSKNSISIHYKHFKIKKVLIHLSRTNITWYLKCFKAIGGICNKIIANMKLNLLFKKEFINIWNYKVFKAGCFGW